VDDSLGDGIKITVVATGFDSRERRSLTPGAVEVQSAGTWSPTPFMRSREDISYKMMKEKEDVVKPKPPKVFPIKPKMPMEEAPKKPSEEEQDEIEIPAFIRKKMM